MLTWLPIGDLHLTEADAQNHRDLDRIGAWPAKGLLDTQLGPNRNGRKW